VRRRCGRRAPQEPLDALGRDLDAGLVLDECDADEALPRRAEADSGATATPACSMSRLVNSSEPVWRKASGIGAQANMLAAGGGMRQPAAPKAFTSASRRRRYLARISATSPSHSSRATMAARCTAPNSP